MASVVEAETLRKPREWIVQQEPLLPMLSRTALAWLLTEDRPKPRLCPELRRADEWFQYDKQS